MLKQRKVKIHMESTTMLSKKVNFFQINDVCFAAQPDIWGLTKGMLQSINILLLKTIPFLVQQNVGLVPDLRADTVLSVVRHTNVVPTS